MQQAGKTLQVLMRSLPCCPAVVCDLGALSLYRITWLLPHHSNPRTVCDLGALSLYRTAWLLPHRPEPHPKHCDSHQGEFVSPDAQCKEEYVWTTMQLPVQAHKHK